MERIRECTGKQWIHRGRERLVQQARNDLIQFRKELTDVGNIAEFHVETGNFLAFADYFLDCFVTDLLVQSKIQDAKKRVDDAIENVDRILWQLGNNEDWE